MTTFLETTDQVQALFVGYFGRAGDPAGASYWIGNLNGKVNTVAQAAASFSVQDEAKAEYAFLNAPFAFIGDVAGQQAFINDVYQNLFNRDADAPGLAYWTVKLQAALTTGNPGQVAQAVGQFVLDVISGATGTDSAAITNKVAVARDFTSQVANANIGWNQTIQDQSEAEIADTTAQASSVVAQKAATTAFIASGDYEPAADFTLKPTIDLLSTNASDTVIGSDTTFTPGDKIIGDGVIELYLGSSSASFSGETITGSDLLLIDADGAATMRATNWTSVDNVMIAGSTGALTLTDLQATSNDSNIGTFTKYWIDDYVTSNTLTMNFDAQAIDGANTTVDLTVKEVTGGVSLQPYTSGAIETLNLHIADATGKTSTMSSLLASGVTTLSIDGGTAGLNFKITGPLDTTLTSIAAGTAASNLNLNASATATNLMATLGLGNDTFNVGGTLSNGDNFDGNVGNDLLAFTIASTQPVTPTVASFATFNAVFTANGEYDASNTSGLNTINLNLNADGSNAGETESDVDFNDLNAETTTVNAYNTIGQLELDYEPGQTVATAINLQTAATRAITIGVNDTGASMRLININNLTVTNTGAGLATILGAINLSGDTETVVIATTQEDGDIDGVGEGAVTALANGGSVTDLTINAVQGDIYLAGSGAILPVAVQSIAPSLMSLMDKAQSLQHYVVTAEGADVYLGRVGDAAAASELESIVMSTRWESDDIRQHLISADGANVNDIDLVATKGSIVIGGLTSKTVNSLNISALDDESYVIVGEDHGGELSDDFGLGTELNAYTITGKGDIELHSAEANGPLVMTELGVATAFDGTFSIWSHNSADNLYGTNVDDMMISYENAQFFNGGASSDDSLVMLETSVQKGAGIKLSISGVPSLSLANTALVNVENLYIGTSPDIGSDESFHKGFDQGGVNANLSAQTEGFTIDFFASTAGAAANTLTLTATETLTVEVKEGTVLWSGTGEDDITATLGSVDNIGPTENGPASYGAGVFTGGVNSDSVEMFNLVANTLEGVTAGKDILSTVTVDLGVQLSVSGTITTTIDEVQATEALGLHVIYDSTATIQGAGLFAAGDFDTITDFGGQDVGEYIAFTAQFIPSQSSEALPWQFSSFVQPDYSFDTASMGGTVANAFVEAAYAGGIALQGPLPATGGPDTLATAVGVIFESGASTTSPSQLMNLANLNTAVGGITGEETGGQERIFVFNSAETQADADGSAAVFYYQSVTANGMIDANEIHLVAVVDRALEKGDLVWLL